MSLIIDGHNLIGALPGIDLSDPEDEALLIDRLRAARSGLGNSSLMVFFDSGLLPARGPDLSSTGIQVRFAAQGQSADDAIVQFIRSRSQPGQYAVVTNDHGLGQRVRYAGASVIAADDFAARLARHRPSGPGEQGSSEPDPRAPAFADIYESFLRAERNQRMAAGSNERQIAEWITKIYEDDPAEAESAIRGLAQHGGSLILGVLQDALTHSQARVRAAALLELGMLRAPSTLTAICERLASDPATMVREAAAQSLGWFGDRGALVALERAAKEDVKGRVRKLAKAAVAQIRGRTH